MNEKRTILYLGSDNFGSTSFHRFCALQRLGHDCLILNPDSIYENSNKIISKVHYITGYKLLKYKVLNWLKAYDELIRSFNPTLIWIDSGELFSKTHINYLKKRYGVRVLLYNIDDPTGVRDGNRFQSLRNAIPSYDLCVVMRQVNVDECNLIGAQKVIRVNRSYDEVAHCYTGEEIPPLYKTDVCFIGTWMRNEGRDIFIHKMILAGINVSIWGNRWDKSPLWNELKAYHKGNSLSGKDYIYAIRGSKICLGFLSKGNRDLHTTRTFEIPAIGGLFCAERTSEHLTFYKENIEAVFWNDVEECITVCNNLLNDDAGREHIRKSGHKKVRQMNAGNENICRAILDELP